MRSPALAIAWLLWGRHRWGLAVVLGYVVTFAVCFQALRAGSLEAWHGIVYSFPFGFALAYVAGVFAFGFDGHLEGKESGFPRWMFTLPVRTSVLVGWPMLQGMAAVALLWLAWAYFVLRPAGIEVPLGLTALLAAAFVTVLQAVLWSPFGLPWARVVVAILVLPTLVLAPQLGTSLGATETGLLCLFGALIPAAFLVAFTGVTRTRRGNLPDWQGLLRLLARAQRRDERRRRPFPSPVRAQLWLEWRRHLPSFPVAVGCFAALHLVLILWVEQGVENRIKAGLNFLIFPPLLASFLGCSLGRAGTSAGNPYALSSFTATRPVSSADLVAAKLKVAALGTLAAWAIVLLAVSVWLGATGIYEQVPVWWNHLLRSHPAWKICGAILLAAVGLFLLTWKLLVDNLFIGLTGSAWIFRGTLLAYGIGFTLAVMLLARSTEHPAFVETLWDVLPWWAGGAVLLKLLVAGFVLRALIRRGLVETQTLSKLLGVWFLLAGGLFILAYAVVPAGFVPVSLLAFGVVLALPLARVAAAPLALAWNRHR